MTPSLAEIQAWQRVVGATPDGNAGPKTYAATVEWFRAHGYIAPPVTTPDARAKVVAIARSQLGERDPDVYWRLVCPALVGRPHDVSWCGGFALWCLREAGLVKWSWIVGAGFLEVRMMPRVQLPEPGDIAYFAKNQHHAIVEGVGGGFVELINGNGMTAPREGVTATRVPLVSATAYYSIARLLP